MERFAIIVCGRVVNYTDNERMAQALAQRLGGVYRVERI